MVVKDSKTETNKKHNKQILLKTLTILTILLTMQNINNIEVDMQIEREFDNDKILIITQVSDSSIRKISKDMGTHSSVKACISVYFTQCQDATVSLG